MDFLWSLLFVKPLKKKAYFKIKFETFEHLKKLITAKCESIADIIIYRQTIKFEITGIVFETKFAKFYRILRRKNKFRHFELNRKYTNC